MTIEFDTHELSDLVNETLSPIIGDLCALKLEWAVKGKKEEDVLMRMVERHIQGLERHVKRLADETNKGLGLLPR